MPALACTLALLLTGPAGAHSPHEVVTAFVPAEGTSPAWLLFLPRDLPMLLRSEDGGRHWDFVASPAVVDDLVDLGRQGQAVAALAAEGRVWWTEDGEPWTSTALPVEGALRMMVLDEELDLVAGEGGAWAGDLLGAPEALVRIAEGEVTALAAGEGRAAVGLSDGRVRLDGGDGLFTDLPALPEGAAPLALALSEDGLWAGTDGAGLFTWDGVTWLPCGALPITLEGGYEQHVPALARVDGRLLAGTGHEAPFVSEDGCATWTDGLADDHVDYRGMGWATDPSQAWAFLGEVDGALAVAGFAGLSWSEDDGRSWTESRIIPGDHVRGLAVDPAWPDVTRLWVGGYGGGLWWTWDGGESWSSSATGLEAAWVYDLQPDPQDGETLFMCGSLSPYRSLDGGQSWEALSDRIPSPRVRAFQPWGDRICALGEEQVSGGYSGRVACSVDGGETWQAQEALQETLGDAIPMALRADGDRTWVIADQPATLVQSLDDGQSWSVLYEGADPEGAAVGVAAWPPGQGQVLLFASTDGGVVASEDGGQGWAATGAPAGEPRALAMAEDGSLWLVLRDGQAWWSDDGGGAWSEVGEPFAAAVHELLPTPGFTEHGLVLAATQDGVFWTDPTEDRWRRLPRFERFEAGTSYLRCEGAKTGCGGWDHTAACEAWSDEDAGLGGGVELREGSVLRFTFAGTGFRVRARGGGRLRAEVDGADLGTLRRREEWTVEGLAPGWKDVVLTHEGGGRLRVDAVEAWGEGEVLPVAGATPDPGGCGGGGGAAALLIGLLPLYRRRLSSPRRS